MAANLERKLALLFEAKLDNAFNAVINAIGSGFEGLEGKVKSLMRTNAIANKSFLELKESIRGVGTSANETTEHVGKLERAFGTILRYGGAASVIYAITTALRGGVQATLEYDQALANVKAVTSATDLQAAQMGESFKKAAQTTRFSMAEIAKGAEEIAQAGFGATDTAKIIGPVTQLAQATLSSIKDSAELITTVLNVFSLGAEKAGFAADVMASAVNKSKLTIEKLNVAMNYVGPVAASASMSLEETAASMMLLSNAGLRASTIGTGLRQVLSHLLDPNKELVQLALNHNMALTELDPRLNSFEKVLQNLNIVLGKSGDEFKVFQQRGAAAGLILARAGEQVLDASGNLVSIFSLIKEDASTFGTVAEMAGATLKGLGDIIDNTKSKLQVMATSFLEGSVALDFFSKAMKALGSLGDVLTKVFDTPGVGGLIKDFLSLTAAVIGLSLALNALKALGSMTGLAAMFAGFGTGMVALLNGTAIRFSVFIDRWLGGYETLWQASKYLWNSLSALFARTPFGVIAVAIAAVTALSLTIIKGFINSVENQLESLGKSREKIEGNISELDNYADALSKVRQGSVSHANIIAQVSEKYGSLSSKLVETNGNIQEQIGLIRMLSDEYQKSLITNKEMEAKLIKKKRDIARDDMTRYGSDVDISNEMNVTTGNKDDAKYLESQKVYIQQQEILAKNLAEIVNLRSKEPVYAAYLVQEYARIYQVDEKLLDIAVKKLAVQNQLAKLHQDSGKEGLTDTQRLEAQNDLLDKLGPEMSTRFKEMRDSMSTVEQSEFWNLFTEFNKSANQSVNDVRNMLGSMTGEQQKAYLSLTLDQKNHEIALKGVEVATRNRYASELAEIKNLQAALAMQYAGDVANKEAHDLQLAKLSKKAAEIEMKIQREVYDYMKRLMDSKDDYFSKTFINKQMQEFIRAAEALNSAAQKTASATRKDFSALVKKEHADQKLAGVQAEAERDQINQYVRMWVKGDEEVAEDRYRIDMQEYARKYAIQESIVAKAKKYNDVTYHQELEKLEELARKKEKSELDYAYIKRQNQLKVMAVQEAVDLSVLQKDKFVAQSTLTDKVSNARAVGDIELEILDVKMTKIRKELALRKDTSGLDYQKMALQLEALRLSKMEKEYEIQKKIATLQYEEARKKLGRGEISEEQYSERLKKAKEMQVITEDEYNEKMVEHNGTFWDRMALGIKRFQDKVKTAGEATVEIVTELAQGIGDSFADAFAKSIDGTEKFSTAFGKMAKSVLANLVKMIIQQSIYNQLAGLSTFIGAGLKALLSGSSLASAATFSPVIYGDTTQVHGGNVNTSGHSVRAGFRLFHSGGISDNEYLAILKRNETVRTEAQEKELHSSKALNFQMVVNNQKDDAKVSMSEPAFDGVRWVATMWITAKSRGMV